MGKHLMEVKADVEGKPYLSNWKGTVWFLKDDASENDDGEFFSERPQTVGMGGHPDNWPSQYTVREGNVDGGDSIVVEVKNALGEVWSLSDEDPQLWRMVDTVKFE